MTVAEELAHLVLHRQIIDQMREPKAFRELQQHYRWHEMERNAKRFAAAILMPGESVAREARSVYRQLVKAVGFKNVPAVQNHLATLLAKRFEVSVQAMRFRLTEWPMRVFDHVKEAMESGLEYWD
jgi:Zn-dependent peptidase ImmA (M78 family)